MKKVLIANRGEIAVRIIRALHELGIQTVAVFSEADRTALHVAMADEAVCIGEAPASKSYLKIPHLLTACEITNADAIHPGYGFLSENSSFAAICEGSGLNFIGPSSACIALMGDKARAKALAKEVGCPVIEGSEGILKDVNEAKSVAAAVGYPIFLKAVAGGGGRGIRVVTEPSQLDAAYSQAQMEALAAFGNPALYLERMIVDPRHVEVQIVGDKLGHYIHLGERDCTVQRRRQKLIEESLSPALTPELREKITQSAVAIAAVAGYFSCGTIEFLLDKSGHFYFMEMNTRIQVEHTVTEELTGVDLVKEQIKIARSEALSLTQNEVVFKGHVIQCRINAEDPSKQFSPTPGCLERFQVPGGPNVRVDSACYAGYHIPPYYDSMIAKLIVKGKNREEAIATAKRALSEFHIEGISSTIPFHLFMLNNDDFIQHRYDIKYIDRLMEKGERLIPLP